MTRRLARMWCILGIAFTAISLGLNFPAHAENFREQSPATPRELFNAGTRKLSAGELAEAEALLRSALATQDERLQPKALYNLGHVRFGEGAKELEKEPPVRGTVERARTAAQTGAAANQFADSALAGDDIQALLAAYVRGRGARKELKAAAEAVRRSLETHTATLSKWRRAAGDFRSAVEMNSDDTNAQRNAEAVDRSIAKLVDRMNALQMAAKEMGDQNSELGEKLKQLRGRIPEPMMPPGAAGDEEELDEFPFGPEPGQQEAPSRSGEEIQLTREEAEWLLEGFRLDSHRRLPMGQGDKAQPRDWKGRDW